MKIAVISSTVFPIPLVNYGGLEQIVYYCAKGLAERGHQVTVFAPLGSIVPGCEIIQGLPPGFGEEQFYGGCLWKTPTGEDVRWPGYWPELLKFNDGGVIINHSWQCWPALLALEGRLKAPILWTLHAPVNTMLQSIQPETICSFVCISEDQKNHFEALFSPRKARTAYNGIDLDIYKPLDIPRTNRYLFLARFSSIKGADIALDACKKTDTEIDLIGDTTITGEPDYYQMCCNLADGTKRCIVGGVPRGEAVWYYSKSKALLHPNVRFREPFGLAPVEAQACGLPVIAWSYGAMPETVKPGETGFLVNSQQEIENLIVSNAIDNIDRKRCREWASQFSIGRMVSRYEELCKEALDKRW